MYVGRFSYLIDTAEIDKTIDNYKKQLEEMKHYILSRTNIDEKTFNKNRSKDWYLTSNELIQFNVIDKFVDTFEDIL